MLNVVGCGGIEQKRGKFCLWAKPLPKEESPYEEILSNEMTDILYRYQKEYNCQCLEECSEN